MRALLDAGADVRLLDRFGRDTQQIVDDRRGAAWMHDELAAPTEQELAELRWLRDGDRSQASDMRKVTSAS